MKNLVICISILALCLFQVSLFSQVPNPLPGNWQDEIQTDFILNPYYNGDKPQFDSASDELGTHVIVRNVGAGGVTNEYRLIGNDGATYLTSSLAQFNHNNLRIAAFNGKVYVFTVDQNNGNIVGRIGTFSYDPFNPSAVIGISWSNALDFENPAVGARINDLRTDFQGIHLVYESGLNPFPNTQTEVYYILYDPTDDTWLGHKNVTEGSTGGSAYGYNPTITLSDDRAHVIYQYNEIHTDSVDSSLFYIRSRDKIFSTNTWIDYQTSWKRRKPIPQNAGPDSIPQILDIGAGVIDETLYAVAQFTEWVSFPLPSDRDHRVIFRKRPVNGSGAEWEDTTLSYSSLSYRGQVEINRRGLDLYKDKRGLHLIFSNLTVSNNYYNIFYYQNLGNGWLTSNSPINQNTHGAGYTPALSSNLNGVNCIWEQRIDTSQNGNIQYSRYRLAVPNEDTCMINPAITADYSYWTGQVILGNNNSGSSSYECITIPIGKTVIVDEQAELFLWGNHLIVKGALHYYHANFHFGVGGAIICDGGTVVAHGSGIVNIDDEGSGISVLAGGSYINASPGLELHFSNDAQFKNDDGYVELADDSGMIFEATSDKLEILAGAEFRLGADALIEVNSYLDAKGSPVKPITFTSLYNEPTPEQYWSYIKLIGQNPGTEPPAMIKNTVIEYGNYGLFVYNGNMTIENNLIRNNYHTNVYFYNSSGVLSDNTIRDAVQSHGVLLFDSSPEFYRNTISFNANTGIHCEYYSSPQFGYDRPGNNVITNNKYGLFARNYSNPFLGHDLGSYGGYNSIYKNVDYAIGAMYNCEVVARINWWGDYPPPAELFYTDITSGIDYLPALESDPNEEMAPLFLVNTQNYSRGNPNDPRIILDLARQFRYEQRYDEAIGVYKQLISTFPNEIEARWGLVEILLAFRETGIDSSVSFLEQIHLVHPNPEMKRVASDLLTGEYLTRGNFREAISNARKNVSSYPGNESEKIALFDLFNIHLNLMKDSTKAQDALSIMEQKYPDDKLTMVAQHQFGNMSGKRAGNFSKGSLVKNNPVKATGEIPEKFESLQNYPNPFNPETTIEFSLPEKASVKMAIYDISGRQIRTLVNEQMDVGFHRVIWDGKNNSGNQVASSVYFYRIEAGGYTTTRKMMLLH